MLTAKVDDRALRAAFRRLGSREALAATSRAVRRAATSVQKEARDIGKREVNLPASAVNQLITVAARATTRKPESEVRVKDKPVALAEYLGERQTRRGVSVQVRRGGARKVIPRTFLATMKSGHRGIFWRRKGEGPTGLVGRLPIDELFARSVRRAIDKTEYVERLLRIARERMLETLRQELRYRLAKRYSL